MKSSLHEEALSNSLLRKLSSIADLSDDEKQAILGMPANVKVFETDTDIVRDGDRPSDCALILSGFVCRYKILPDGRRQIMGFYIPGDIPDLQSLHLHVLDNSLGTLVKQHSPDPAPEPAGYAEALPQPEQHPLARYPDRCGYLP